MNSANAASRLAKLGFIEPTLWTGTAGAIHLHDHATGKVRQTIQMAQKKRAAWTQVLAALSTQGIDVSADWAKEPFEASINDTVGILWDNKGVTVSAWVWDMFAENIYVSRRAEGGASNIFEIGKNRNESFFAKRNGAITLIGYTNKTPNGYSFAQMEDMTIWSRDNYDAIYIRNDKYTDAASFKAAMNGQLAVIELATPIRIDFEDGELSTAFVDVQPNDLFTIDDMDGNPMYDILITTEEREGHHYRRTLLAPSADWIEQHHRLPCPLVSTLKGIGITFNHDTLYQYLMDETASPIWQAIHALQNK